MLLDPREMPVYVINLRREPERREFMQGQLDALGLDGRFITGVACRPGAVGCAISHLKTLKEAGISVPFLVLEDDCKFIRGQMQYTFEVPERTDALYLGHSQFGLQDKPDKFGLRWGRQRNVKYQGFDDDYIRIFNMLSRHAIIYVSEDFVRQALQANLNALLSKEFTYPGDVAYAELQSTAFVLATRQPLCYQTKEHGGMEVATRGSVTETGAVLEAL